MTKHCKSCLCERTYNCYVCKKIVSTNDSYNFEKFTLRGNTKYLHRECAHKLFLAIDQFRSNSSEQTEEIGRSNLKKRIRIIRDSEVYALKVHAKWKQTDIANLFKISKSRLTYCDYGVRRDIERYKKIEKSKNEIQHME